MLCSGHTDSCILCAALVGGLYHLCMFCMILKLWLHAYVTFCFGGLLACCGSVSCPCNEVPCQRWLAHILLDAAAAAASLIVLLGGACVCGAALLKMVLRLQQCMQWSCWQPTWSAQARAVSFDERVCMSCMPLR